MMLSLNEIRRGKGVHDFCDLAGGPALRIVQDDDTAVGVGQPNQGVTDFLGGLSPGHDDVGVDGVVVVMPALLHLHGDVLTGVLSLATVVINGRVVGDAEQP